MLKRTGRGLKKVSIRTGRHSREVSVSEILELKNRASRRALKLSYPGEPIMLTVQGVTASYIIEVLDREDVISVTPRQS